MQFSLKELLKLEDERLAEQERSKIARELEREEEARRRQAEAATAARMESEAREQQRQRELEAIARREAMQKAIVEQARLEVEGRARADERERERRHEFELERLRAERVKGRSSSLGSLIGAAGMGGGIAFAVMLAVQFGAVKPAEERRVAELHADVAAAERRADDLTRQATEQRRALTERDRQLEEARIEIAALKAKKTSPDHGPAPAIRKLVPAAGRKASGQAESDCAPRDPMCFSLKQ